MKNRLLKIVRQALRFYPCTAGKGFLANLMVTDGEIPDGEIAESRAGVRIFLRPDWMYKHLYLYGEYEQGNTDVFSRIVRPGDLCIDAGASFGYYSCLMGRLGATVYGFEPLPEMFKENRLNVELNGLQKNVFTVPSALGTAEGKFKVNTFTGLSRGHASACDLGRSDAVPHECEITTLDIFCRWKNLHNVAFIKIDVEGWEIDVLRGGPETLSMPDAPIIHFEVNESCLACRNIDPNAIFDTLRGFGYKQFYRISRSGSLEGIDRISSSANADYLAVKEGRLKRLK